MLDTLFIFMMEHEYGFFRVINISNDISHITDGNIDSHVG
jgi:hypothetical protein